MFNISLNANSNYLLVALISTTSSRTTYTNDTYELYKKGNSLYSKYITIDFKGKTLIKGAYTNYSYTN